MCGAGDGSNQILLILEGGEQILSKPEWGDPDFANQNSNVPVMISEWCLNIRKSEIAYKSTR